MIMTLTFWRRQQHEFKPPRCWMKEIPEEVGDVLAGASGEGNGRIYLYGNDKRR